VSAWDEGSTLAEVDWHSGRIVQRLHLGRTARITYSEHHMSEDTQILTAALESTAPTAPTAALSRAGGRKFIVAMAILASVTALCWTGKVDATAYAAVVIGVMGLYGAANVAQKATAKAAA